MRRFRLWLARKLVGTSPFMANMTLTAPVSTTTNTDAVWGSSAIYFGPGEYTEDEMGKKKKRSKAAGKAAAKNKQENKQKAKGGKGAR